jgi:O-methyltransferase
MGCGTVNSDIRDSRASVAAPVQSGTHERLVNLYLDLLEQTLTGAILEDVGLVPSFDPNPVLADRYDENVRSIGMDWPSRAVTMVGLKRLGNLRQCAADVLKNNVPGDFIETGVWRGGASIYLRALLAAYGVTDRRVWVADSFAGLPPPNPVDYPADKGDELFKATVL